jgi:hypothetical protein
LLHRRAPPPGTPAASEPLPTLHACLLPAGPICALSRLTRAARREGSAPTTRRRPAAPRTAPRHPATSSTTSARARGLPLTPRLAGRRSLAAAVGGAHPASKAQVRPRVPCFVALCLAPATASPTPRPSPGRATPRLPEGSSCTPGRSLRRATAGGWTPARSESRAPAPRAARYLPPCYGRPTHSGMPRLRLGAGVLLLLLSSFACPLAQHDVRLEREGAGRSPYSIHIIEPAEPPSPPPPHLPPPSQPPPSLPTHLIPPYPPLTPLHQLPTAPPPHPPIINPTLHPPPTRTPQVPLPLPAL